jgi:hypothetical protein
MNTIDATPLLSLGARATLAARHYPLVNLMPRTNTRRRENRRQCDLW